jgi:hypothetical protein
MAEIQESTDQPKLSDNFIRLTWEKLEHAKTDLEHNWTQQMIAIVFNIGLIFGLGQTLSNYLLKEQGHESILAIGTPIVILYLFTRFGALLTVYRKLSRT